MMFLSFLNEKPCKCISIGILFFSLFFNLKWKIDGFGRITRKRCSIYLKINLLQAVIASSEAHSVFEKMLVNFSQMMIIFAVLLLSKRGFPPPCSRSVWFLLFNFYSSEVVFFEQKSCFIKLNKNSQVCYSTQLKWHFKNWVKILANYRWLCRIVSQVFKIAEFSFSIWSIKIQVCILILVLSPFIIFFLQSHAVFAQQRSFVRSK